MKFLCVKCNSFMEYESLEEVDTLRLGVTFSCKACGNKIALVTNPGETQLVSGLGVKIGGRTTPPGPMEFTREVLKTGGEGEVTAGTGACPFSEMVKGMGQKKEEQSFELTWSKEAQERIERVPPFLRPMIQGGVEAYARKKGHRLITPEIMDESKNNMGVMEWTPEAERRLENIPSFIRPMARLEIERMAMQKGRAQVTEDLMEEAREKFLGMGTVGF